MSGPLILTLWLEPGALESLTALRRAHFPPERDFLPAHVTLFHALPPEHRAEVRGALEEVCAATSRFALELPKVRSLGRGVALEVHSPQLMALRGGLAGRWSDWLTPQDRQGYRPHVTVQNKVTAEQARALYARLSAEWVPVKAEVLGLELWRYLGGPWARLEGFGFGGERWTGAMFGPAHKALALEFARRLAARDYAAAHDLCSAGLRERVGLEQLRQDFERMIPLDWGAVEPIEVVEGDDWPFVYVALGGEAYSEAVIVGAFVTEENTLKVDGFELGRP